MKQTHTHPILRRHAMITGKVEPLPAKFQDDFVKVAVEGLQSLASKAPAKPLQLAPPTKEDIKDALARAGQIAKSFGPLAAEHGTATLNSEAA